MKLKWTVLFVLTAGLFLPQLTAQSADWNLDFEYWDLSNTTPGLWHDTMVIENRVGLFPPNWHYRPDHIPERTGLGRTTDATHGNYAVTLSGFYGYEVMRIISGNDAKNSGWPIDTKPARLTGDYKAILLGSCDSLKTYVDVYLTKYDEFHGNRDTIGAGHIILDETSDAYTSFELDINYSEEDLLPDTVIVVLAEQRFGFDAPPACLECSHVFFDNLIFEEPLSVARVQDYILDVKISPNPADHTLFFAADCQHCNLNMSIIGSDGRIYLEQRIVGAAAEIDVSDMKPGIYFVRIEDPIHQNNVIKKVTIL